MNWGDVAIHCGIAAAVTAIGAIAGWHWWAALAVSVVFVVREAAQDRQKQGAWRGPWAWSAQKIAEAAVPVVVAFAVAGAWTLAR